VWLYSSVTGAQMREAAPPNAISVDWDYRPSDLNDLTSNSQAVLEAFVVEIKNGEPLTSGDPEDPSTTPTQRITLHVTRTLAGQSPDDLELFQIGSPTEQIATDPSYLPGERYLLFVRRRMSDEDPTQFNPDGTWITTAPDGRLEIDSGKTLDAPIADAAGLDLDGDTLSHAQSAIDPELVAAPDPTPDGPPTDGGTGETTP
jgi:hypothetical protein